MMPDPKDKPDPVQPPASPPVTEHRDGILPADDVVQHDHDDETADEPSDSDYEDEAEAEDYDPEADEEEVEDDE